MARPRIRPGGQHAGAVSGSGRGGSGWGAFLVRRTAGLVLVLAALIVLTFAIVRLVPGDPVRSLVGVNASPQVVAAVRRQLGLDQPLPSQFLAYLSGLAHGNLGTSFETKGPVTNLIKPRVLPTVEIAGLALIVVLIVSIPAGMLAASIKRRHAAADHTFVALAGMGGAMPEYVTGTLLVLLFGLALRLLPVAGDSGADSLILPVAAVALAPTCMMTRLMRREVMHTLSQEFIVTARSKHLSRCRFYVRHVLPNALTGTLTVGGLLLAGLLGGTVTVESVFAWPGLGTAVVQAIQTQDYPVIQSVILILGCAVVVINLIVDVLLAVIDPRTRAIRLGSV